MLVLANTYSLVSSLYGLPVTGFILSEVNFTQKCRSIPCAAFEPYRLMGESVVRSDVSPETEADSITAVPVA